jgi:hypothetical protein
MVALLKSVVPLAAKKPRCGLGFIAHVPQIRPKSRLENDDCRQNTRISGEAVLHNSKTNRVYTVQRCPHNRKIGRIHTSTATVAVLPEIHDQDQD